MKFIHFADAHLDSPFRGLSFLPSKAFKQVHEAADQSLSKIVDLALSEQVDLVLIAGDTFDSNHPSPRSQVFFAKEIKRLTDAKIQVAMIFGNHDHMKHSELLLPDNPYFHLIGESEKVERISLKTQTGFAYDLVGFSYENNHILEDKLPAFPEKTECYTFGLMHAQEKSSEKSQNVYAPFTLSELQNLNYDYFALGHIHLRQVLSQDPLIAYSGNIQGRHINELGAKGCYLGEINESDKSTQIHFCETSPIVWRAQDVYLTDNLSKNDLQEKLMMINDLKQTTYFSLRLHGGQFLTEEEEELLADKDYWNALSNQLPFHSRIVDLRFAHDEQKLALNPNDLAFFEQAEKELFEQGEFKKISQDWLKKDVLSQKIGADKDFEEEVRTLAKIKLAKKLKGINDEAQED